MLYECAFHIQAFGTRNITETKDLIHKLLTTKHTDNVITIQAGVIEITHIEPGICPEDTTKGIYGEYIWPSGEPEQNTSIGCYKNPAKKGYRQCDLDPDSEKATWRDPDFSKCKPVFTFSNLGDLIVTANNTADVVGIIEDLVNSELGSDGSLTGEELNTVVDKLAEVMGVATVTPELGSKIIGIISDLLGSDTVLSAVGNRILNLIESVGNKMFFSGESANVTVPSLAVSMVNVDPDQFHGLTFGVSSFSTGLVPEIFVNQSFVSDPFEGAVASISLPSALETILHNNGNRRRVQFQFYGVQELFKDMESNLTLNTYVVSASVSNSLVSNLNESVVVILRHLKPKETSDRVQCVYWDFQKNNGQGGWSSQGCETESRSAYLTSCRCNHLTHFGVLLVSEVACVVLQDVSRTPISEKDRQILSIISYLGCGVSSIFLGINLLTYTAFGKLRKDYPSKILLNLSGALLGLNMVFLLNSWLSSFNNYGLCITTAVTLHYFMLASFTWMALEAVHMYFALVKVFNIYVPSYILKFCALGWGLPLVIVSLVLAIDMDAYGNDSSRKSADDLQNSESFCWLQSNVVFYITVLAFVLLVMLINLSVFIVVLVQIRNMRTNKPAGNKGSMLQDLRAAASLTFLLGLTWPLAFFALGPAKVPLLYFFSILNSLQGFFIFVFHCLMKENVRKQWRIHLCCGRFRLNDYSDWSRSVTCDRSKQNQLVNSPSLRSVDTSSSRKISESSTGSAPVHF
ncbi:adhesion G-protein coupled receptor G2 [Osmerus eperlanus]|uniref:adhesion G-protein coupled receptor G2 n=1 Tax=Osmerus eperlanus TaxID=29151 RepID=UPI002E1278C5